MPVAEILKLNSGPWEIEESFRILGTYMKARPSVCLQSFKNKSSFYNLLYSVVSNKNIRAKIAFREI